MFEGFDDERITLQSGITLRVRQSGDGPALLLLHGYPQTHVCWHYVAPRLVDAGYRVILSDLRGYGDSDKPSSDAKHTPYSKREMAADQAALMEHLGHKRYFVAGHDRGGRVAHRLCRDNLNSVAAATFLDIVPTDHMYENTDQSFATGYYHWFFLIQPEPLPETLINHDPGFYLKSKLFGWSRSNDKVFSEPALAEYIRCFDEKSVHTTCEDYRAGATVDLEHDAEDKGVKLNMPIQVLWGGKGLIGKQFNVREIWNDYAHSVEGEALPCGHFIPDEEPQRTADALIAFFGKHKETL